MLPITLIGCVQQPADGNVLAAVEAKQRANTTEDGAVPCALPGKPLRRECLVERTGGGNEGLILTLRHPDGAFRRLLVTRDGRGVVAADGAEPATVRVLGADRIEVTVAGEHYELPATVKGGAER